MNKFFLPLLVSSLLIISCAKTKVSKIPLPDGFIENDWSTAVSVAKDNDRKIFVQFYADWCSLCATFKDEVLNDPEVKTYLNEHFINVLMDTEKGEGPILFSKYQLSGHPQSAMIGHDELLIGNHAGKMDKTQFLAWVKQYE